VVKPETVSNIASIGWGILPEIIKGRAPAILSTSQLRATVTAPSLAWNTLLFLFLLVSGIPIVRQISIVIRNARPFFSR
jgi:hypothetical protein